jgi:hypothetical protein
LPLTGSMQRAGKPACAWEADKRPYVGVTKRGHLRGGQSLDRRMLWRSIVRNFTVVQVTSHAIFYYPRFLGGLETFYP